MNSCSAMKIGILRVLKFWDACQWLKHSTYFQIAPFPFPSQIFVFSDLWFPESLGIVGADGGNGKGKFLQGGQSWGFAGWHVKVYRETEGEMEVARGGSQGTKVRRRQRA